MIFLLRVACVTTPAWLETTAAQASLFHVPEGLAWACVLGLVQNNLGTFAGGDGPLLLGFIEDWARGVSWQSPYPEGAESVAAIATGSCRCSTITGRMANKNGPLQVIAKIPNADQDRFAALLQGTGDDKERNIRTEEFREIIFEGMEGMP